MKGATRSRSPRISLGGRQAALALFVRQLPMFLLIFLASVFGTIQAISPALGNHCAPNQVPPIQSIATYPPFLGNQPAHSLRGRRSRSGMRSNALWNLWNGVIPTFFSSSKVLDVRRSHLAELKAESPMGSIGQPVERASSRNAVATKSPIRSTSVLTS